MTTPPARNTLSGTPTNAQFNAGIGALYDYTVGLLGAAGTPAAARAALGAVGLTGNETIAGVKRFTSNIAIGPNAPATPFDIQTTGENVLTTTWTTGISDPSFRLGAVNGVAGIAAGASQGRVGLFYMGWGEVAMIDFRRGATATDGSIAFRTNGIDRATLSNLGDFTASGNITAGGQFIGNGAGLTNLAAAQLTGDVAAARITNALNASGSAPIYACRAWVNFDGTGTVAIRASGNVSSITDNGVGDYTVNFTTALPDANYACVFGSMGFSLTNITTALVVAGDAGVRNLKSTTQLRIQVGSSNTGGLIDNAEMNVAIFR